MASTVALPDEPRESLMAGQGIPWLLSASSHCLLLIALAMCVSMGKGSASHSGPTTGISLDAAAVRSSYAPELYDDERPIVALSNAENPASEKFMPELPPVPQPDAGGGGANTGSGGVGAGPLAEVLGGKPAIDFSGALPAAAPNLGGASLEGGGVGTAKAATSGSKGTKDLRGGYARTGVFGVQGEGYKFAYVFDRSGSMGGHGGSPLAAAKQQLIASLQALGPTHQFQIIFYNEHPQVFNPSGVTGRLVFANDQNKQYAQNFVGSITADGATEHEDALALALKLAPDVIFFLTDADEPRMNSQQMARIARLNKGTSINAIEFGYGPQGDSENFLVRLARENGGKHVYVDIANLPQP